MRPRSGGGLHRGGQRARQRQQREGTAERVLDRRTRDVLGDELVVADTATMQTAGAPQQVTRDRLTAPLLRLDQELDAALETLSGRTTVPILVSRATGLPETPAQARARAALLLVGRMPLEARSFLETLTAARGQGFDKDELQALLDQGRAVRRGVKRLKVELKRLRRSRLQFVK